MTTNNTTTIALPQKMRGTATVYNDLTFMKKISKLEGIMSTTP